MAYMNSADVAAIRKELKDTFPKFKFGVRKDNSMAVRVTIKSGPTDFSDIMAGRKYAQINGYHLCNYGQHTEFLSKIQDIIKTAPMRGEGYRKQGWYDNSDAMTDYFDTAYYIDISIGQYDQPYEVK